MNKFLLLFLIVFAGGLVVAEDAWDAGASGSESQEVVQDVHPQLVLDGPFKPTWASLETHQLPQWFSEMKLGLSMHWGAYSVPGWAQRDAGIGGNSYSEWYWSKMRDRSSVTWKYHLKNYGEHVVYDEFIDRFLAEDFDADQWMQIIKNAGFKYYYITSKHHDGFCLWDSKVTDRTSVKMGPKRDILRELTDAARKYEIKIGFYYSLYEWFNPDYVEELTGKTWLGTVAQQIEANQDIKYSGIKRVESYVDDFMIPQIVELIDNYSPDFLVLDGEWDHPESYWKTKQIAAYYYNKAYKEGKEVFINDRFGIGSRGRRGDYYHVEYFADVDKTLPWAMWRGFGKSFGYNKNEDIEQILTVKEAIEMIADCVSDNGNVEFNVGPMASGQISELDMSVISGIGEWMAVNGESIYNAEKSPFGKLNYGRVSHKPSEKVLFLHVFKWNCLNVFRIYGCNFDIEKAEVLGIPDMKINVKQIGSILKLKCFGKPDLKNVPVIKLTYK